MQESSGRSAPIAAILAIAGGVLLAVGSFLTWAEVSGGGTSVTAKGTDGSDGWITFGAGLIVLAIGVLFMRGGGKKVLAILAIVAALVGGGVGLYDALTAKDRVLDDAAKELAGQFGGTPAQVRVLLDQAIDAGQLGITLGIGLYIVIAGGALGVVGGFLGMRGSAAAPAIPAMGTMAAAAPAVEAPMTPPRTPPSMPEAAPPVAPPPMPEAPASGGSAEGGS
jgi:hypothetical protein